MGLLLASPASRIGAPDGGAVRAYQACGLRYELTTLRAFGPYTERLLPGA
jgi:hypothetical protein